MRKISARLNLVRGDGKLKLNPAIAGTPQLPELSSEFTTTGGGEVEFAGGSYDLPTIGRFNDLTISGVASTKTVIGNIDIEGNLTVTEGSLDIDDFNVNRRAGGGNLTLAAGSALIVSGEDNFPRNYTYMLDVASTVEFNKNEPQFLPDIAPGNLIYGNLTLSRNNGNAHNKNLSNDLDVRGNLMINPGVVLITNDFDMAIGGNWIRDIGNQSDFRAGRSRVTFDGSVDQFIDLIGGTDTETFYDIVIDNGPAADVTIASTFSTFTILNDLILNAGAGGINLENDIRIGGDLINNSGPTVFKHIASTTNVTFYNTSEDQVIGGSQPTTFYDMTLEKTSGLVLTVNNGNGGISVVNALTMANDGNIALTGTNNDIALTQPGSTITDTSGGTLFGSNRMIVTEGTATASTIVKTGDATADSYDLTFPIGVGGDYTPVTINATAVTGTGSISVRSVTGNAGAGDGLDGLASEAIDRYFEVTLDGSISDFTASYDFTYADGDVQGTETDYIAHFWETNLDWTLPVNDFVTADANQFGSNGAGMNITGAAPIVMDWIAGTNKAFYVKLYSSNEFSGGDWSNHLSWTIQPDGSKDNSDMLVPGMNNDVEILSGHTIVTNANDQDVFSLELNGTLDMVTNLTTFHDFGALNGTGILQVGNNFPGLIPGKSNFLKGGGGTVEFLTTSSYSLPNSVSVYNDLSIGGGGGSIKTLSTGIRVMGDLNIESMTTLDVDVANNYSLFLGGAFNTADLTAVFEPRNGLFVLMGSSAQSLPNGITFYDIGFQNIGTKSITEPKSVHDFTIFSSSGDISLGGHDLSVASDWSNAAFPGQVINQGQVRFIVITEDCNISGSTVFDDVLFHKGGRNVSVRADNTVTTLLTTHSTMSGNIATGTNELLVSGDWVTNNPISVTGTVNFNGTDPQEITGDLTFENWRITGGSTLRLRDNITLSGNLSLEDGIILSNDTDGLLNLLSGATISGGSGTSHVKAKMTHEIDVDPATTVFFPLGDGINYRPVELDIDQLDATSHTYAAELRLGPPAPRTLPTGPQVYRVSWVRHYTITQAPNDNITSGFITIFYGVDDEVTEGINTAHRKR